MAKQRTTTPQKPVQELLAVLETLRVRKGGGRGRFSVDAINYAALDCYKDMRYGKQKDPPPRDEVIMVANYLGCNVAEMNQLLLSCGYQPKQVYLQGDELEQALRPCREIVDYLPLPAFVITRDWRIWHANSLIPIALMVTESEQRAVPPEHFNLMHLVFNDKSPYYDVIRPSPEAWQRMARGNILAFKWNNALSADEVWHTNWVQMLSELRDSGFREFWEETAPSPIHFANEDEGRIMGGIATKHMFEIKTYAPPGGGPPSIKIQVVHLFSGDLDFPAIQCYKPFDEEAEKWYDLIGLPTQRNNWTRGEDRSGRKRPW